MASSKRTGPVKTLVVFGTRPEAIKLAPLIHEMRKDPKFVVTVLCTGQHTDLLQPVLDHFGIQPDINLNVMLPNQTLSQLTANVMAKIAGVWPEVQPELVIVQGDTTSAFVAALAGFYHKVKIAHVEAGLRSHDLYSPFPEEANRVLAGHLSDFHFAPTPQSAGNLKKEGLKKNVYSVGNTVIDALFLCLQLLKGKGEEESRRHFDYVDWSKKVILVTSHRRESYGEGVKNICAAIEQIAARGDTEIVFATHPNPNMRKPIFDLLQGKKHIHLIEPLSYERLVWLMSQTYMILTDSGGIQEEAPSLGKPVLVMRSVTERMEGVRAGTAVLVGTDTKKILKHAKLLLDNKKAYAKMAKAKNPYGDGKSSQRILKILKKAF